MRKLIKVCFPAAAFLPALPVALNSTGVIADSVVVEASKLFYLPVFSFAALAQTFGGAITAVVTAIIVWIVWSIFIAFALKQVANVVTSPQFDWVSFRDGFIVGGIVGALFGWYAWVRFLWKSLSLPTCAVLGVLITGTAVGISFGNKWIKDK